ncbi:MAG: subclass B3 metallo-beta-lactamase [Candidatus Polarisedimenticolia bacterium]
MHDARRASSILLLCFALSACGGAGRHEADLQARAAELARRFIIVDTHIDVPDRLVKKQDEDLSVRTPDGDFDHPRAAAGGLDAPFMSIYVPASYQKTGGAKAYADGLIDLVESFSRKWPDKFALATSPADVRRNAEAGLISLPMGMENGAPVEDDLANLKHFFDRGIRYITLTHGEDNQICDSSYNKGERRWRGLSPFGRQVVEEMNRLGIMVDVSHISDEAVRQVMEMTRAPAIASHSSCRHFTPGWERNMSDELIQALAAKGGVIMINFGSSFLTHEARVSYDAHSTAAKAFREKQGIDSEDPKAKEFSEAWWKEHRKVYATVDDVVAHIDHVVELAGIDHVGIGSDFDGVGDSLPVGLKDVSAYPSLIAALLKRGYSERDIEKICGGNLLRVWTEVERAAGPMDTRSWYEPAEPVRIAGPVHYVGTQGLGAYLIATPQGHILIDGAMPGSGPLIEASIRKLGYEPKDIRLLLITHAHMDHVGTLAHFKKLSGAKLAVMEPEAGLLKSGGKTDYLYADDDTFHFEPVAADRMLKDNDTVELGGVTLTARHTPGHTRGCTTWVTTIEDGGRSYRVAFMGSTSVNPGTRLVNEPSYPGIADDYRRSLAMLASLEPDIFLAPHPGFFDFEAKRGRAAAEGARAFVDPEGYRQRVAEQTANLESTLAKEGKAALPAEVHDVTWQWVSFTTPVEQVTVDALERYTLRFSGDGTVAVRADCNRGKGTFTVKPDKHVALGPLALTRMACPPGSLSDRFVRELGRVSTWFVKDGELYLELPVDSGTFRFRRGI